MLDWKITEDEPRPDRPRTETDPTPPSHPTNSTARRLWIYAIIVIIAIIAGAGGWVVWNRVQKGDEAMQRDVLAFIQREEQARRLGQRENVGDFLQAGLSPDFVEAYAALYKTPEVPSGVEVTLAEFDVKGDTAQVVVGLGAQRQRRTYRLTQDGWRRVPLNTEWGAETTISEGEGIQVIAQESDADFARTLLEDMPTLETIVAAWDITLPSTATLRIEPTELQGVVLSLPTRSDSFSVNSPQVTEVPHHWPLSGEVAVRYEVANFVLGHVRPSRANILATPQHARLWDAAREVMALRWAMEPDAYTAVVAGWRTTALADGWQNPLDSLITLDTTLDPFAPHEAAAEMLLLADTLYAETGQDGIIALFHTTPTAANWDDAFRAVTGETTAALQARARGDGIAAVVSPTFPLTGHLPPDQPVPITMRGVPFVVDGLANPIVVEDLMSATLTVEMGDGTQATLPGSCTTIFPSMTLQGEWLEEGLRVHATTLTVTNFADTLFQGPPPPPDTVAYITLDNRLQDEQEQTQGRQLRALLADGSTVPILTWSLPTLHVAPPSAMLGNDAIFFQGASGDGSCPVTWVARYRPDTGIDGVWLVASQLGTRFPQLLWDTLTNRGMMTQPASDGLSTAYWWLTPGENTLLGKPDGTISYGDVQLLRPGHDEVVMPVDIGQNQLMLRRIDVNTGAVAQEYFDMLSGARLATAYDPTGRYLFAAPTIRDSVNPGVSHSEGNRYDEDTNTHDLLWPLPMGVMYSVFPDAAGTVWYAETFSPESRRAFYLLGNASPQPVFVSNLSRVATQLVACQSGGAAYVTGAARLDRPVADSLYILTRINATGEPRFADIPSPDGATLVMCR